MSDGRVTVEHELCGPVALLLRLAVTRWRQEAGVLVRHDIHRLIDQLADASRVPPGDIAAAGKKRDAAADPGDRRLVDMSTAAEATGIPARTLRWRCANGRVPGAVLVAGRWAAPQQTIEEIRRAL